MWIRHVPSMNDSCHTCDESCHASEGVLSRRWMNHVTHVNKSCSTCSWVMCCRWMSHVTHVNRSCPTCEWVMSQRWMSHVTNMNESCPVDECVTSHVKKKDDRGIDDPCVSHIRMGHVIHTDSRVHIWKNSVLRIEWLPLSIVCVTRSFPLYACRAYILIRMFAEWLFHALKISHMQHLYDCMSRVIRMNESCLTYTRGMPLCACVPEWIIGTEHGNQISVCVHVCARACIVIQLCCAC